MSRLYVGSLPYHLDADALRVLFEQRGQPVKRAWVVLDRATQRSRGFGFVDLDGKTDANAVIGDMHGLSVGDKRLVVSVVKPSGPRRGERQLTTSDAARTQPTARGRRS